MLKVGTSARTVSFVRNDTSLRCCCGNPIIGFHHIPLHTVLSLVDPVTQQPPSLVETENVYTRGDGGHGGALTDDGVNYCAPFLAS